MQLVRLQKDLQDIEAAGAQVVGISYDSVDVLKRFSKQSKIEYLLLSDEDSKIIDAYGIRNKEAQAGTPAEGIPNPGTYLVDKKGVVQAKWFLPGYVQRPDNKLLIEAAQKLN